MNQPTLPPSEQELLELCPQKREPGKRGGLGPMFQAPLFDCPRTALALGSTAPILISE